MKYAIDNLIKNTDVLCHETRTTQHGTNTYVTHFLICRDDDKTNPYFTMGYEFYTDHSYHERPLQRRYGQDNRLTSFIESGEERVKADFGYLHSYGLVSKGDLERNLFVHNAQLEISPYDSAYDLTNDAPRLATAEQSDRIKTQERDKKHSMFRSDIHMSKEKKIDNQEFSMLFDKYRAYIGKEVTADLKRESDFNIDMEKIFGMSFDWERVKTGWFGKDNISGSKELVE